MKKKILLVSQDSKVILQVRQWLRELPEETSLETFPTLQDFIKDFLTEPAVPLTKPVTVPVTMPATVPATVTEPEVPITEAGDANSNVARYVVKEPARLLCIDTESVAHQPHAMQLLIKVRIDFLKGPFSTKDFPARVIAIAHEHSNLSVDALAQAHFDDLQIKPLDHEMFLQKAGMYLADETSTSSKFLFKQATSHVIEMAKESTLEEISDFGLAILNPVPLAPGVYAHIHSPIFGENEDQAVWGRVYRSTRHPTHADAYLCYCAFFGIKSAQMHNVRKYVYNVKRALHWPAVKNPPATFKGLPCHIAVIDRDEHVRAEIKTTLEGNFSNAKVHVFRSYSHFMKTLVSQSKEHPTLNVSAEPIPVLPGGSELTFYVGGETWDLHEISPAMSEKDRFCGLFPDQLKASPTKWIDCVDPEDRAEFDELLISVQSGASGQMVLRLKDNDGFQYPVQLKGFLQRTGAGDGSKLLRIEWSILKDEDWVKEMENRSKDGHALSSLDALFTSATGVSDVAAWYEGTIAVLGKAGVIKNGRLPICLMEDENNPFLQMQQFRVKNIQAFMFRPIDHKTVMAKASQMVPGLLASSLEVDLRFVPTKVAVRLAKEIEMDEVSEYGLQIKSSVPLKADVFLRFYSPLLDQNGHGILAKCVSCVQDEADKKVFHCFFMFFGVSEAFLKHVRNWIREDYVAKKENEA